jgi:putative restriction endonuclease
MTREEWLDRLSRLRRSTLRGGVRAPHKPLLLLWLIGQFARTGTTAVTYQDAETPVSDLIIDFGPARRRPGRPALMPFIHLEPDLWQLSDGTGQSLHRPPDSRRFLLDHHAHGQLAPDVEQLLTDPAVLVETVHLLVDQHFTPGLAEAILERVGLDLPTLPPAADGTPRAVRDPQFPERILRAYAYCCAICGYDGRLGRNPVGLQAAHVRWHSHGGPNSTDNGLALCALDHTLLDLGVLGLTPDHTIQVSPLYVATTEAGTRIHHLTGQRLRQPQPGHPPIGTAHIDWHTQQVFKDAA